MRSAEPTGRWRPPLRQQACFLRSVFLTEVGEDLFDHHRVFSASASCVALPRASLHSDAGKSLPRERSECFGHDPDRATASLAGLDVDVA